MPLLTLQNVHLAYGHVALLDGVDLAVEPGERLALIGRNGTGKSSLLRGIAGDIAFDDGQRIVQSGMRLATVAQEPLLDPAHRVFDAVAAGLSEQAAAIAEYQHLTHQLAAAGTQPAPGSLERLAALQAQLDASGAWAVTHRIDSVLTRLGLDGEASVASLSGGTRKRVALARALVAEPDLLLLDEPTNHLDIESIAWLESLLVSYRGALIVITHDRRFLDRVATRVIELDRGKLRSYPGSFSAYQTRKADELAHEAVLDAKFDKVLAQEEVWIRKGVEARRTRNEGRVRRLEALRRQRSERRERLGHVNLTVDAGERSGKLVAELIDVTKSWGERTVVRNFSTIVQRGDRIGLIGPNGAGKTTLLKLMLGEIEPDTGTVRLGTNLNIAYFDQLREQLDEEAPLVETISPGSDWIEIGGRRTHVMSYLERFLFAPQRSRSPVRSLSGGERNRLLLARLFARPANLLVLDEPTNDLDIETLELLEELLAEYPGTVLIVSHDRTFLDNVVTQSIVALGDGQWREYAGGYSDVEATRGREAAQTQTQAAPVRGGANAGAATGATTGASAADDVAAGTGAAAAAASTAGDAPSAAGAAAAPRRVKLSYKEQRELDALPQRIADLEAEQKTLGEKLADPSTYQNDAAGVAAMNERFAAIEEELLTALERWEALEARR
ncbi:MAG: ATP-binding cassette domain-containing protein [Burkholderiales bacterium]|nr:ATP-binding cassette domain-containing protein [Burkholderiales bacterium]